MPHKEVKSTPSGTPHKSGWEMALADAQAQLDEARRRVRDLRRAVQVCEERVRDGEPFPGEASSAQPSGA